MFAVKSVGSEGNILSRISVVVPILFGIHPFFYLSAYSNSNKVIINIIFLFQACFQPTDYINCILCHTGSKVKVQNHGQFPLYSLPEV